ncbi:MAG: YncE family protein [Methylococcaceae bacterium]|nr:MAG: YncE family protein [Methylococcaceae bacterium]
MNKSITKSSFICVILATLSVTHGAYAAAPIRLPEVVALVPTGGLVFSTALSKKRNEVYAVDARNKMLYVIDGKTNTRKEKATLDLQDAVVNGIAYNETTDEILLVDYAGESSRLLVLDRKTMEFVGSPIALDSLHAAKVVIDEATDTAYVSNMHSGTVSVVDLKNQSKIADIVIGTGAPTPAGCNPWDSANPCTTPGGNPLDMKINPKTHKVYVASYTEGTISVIDTRTNKVEGARIPVGSQPNGMGIDTGTNRVYVNNWQDGTVSVIDGDTDTVIGEPIVVGSGLQDPLHCYEAGKLDACKSWGSMPLGPIGVNEDKHLVYVASSNDGTVITINGKTNKVVGEPVHITTGPLVPGGCANFGACTQGSSAQNVIYNPKTDRLYVVSLADAWLMVLQGQGSKTAAPPSTHNH